MEKAPTCNKCGKNLIVGENWTNSRKLNHKYICKDCNNCQTIRYRREKGVRPISENKTCSSYLGCHIAERLLSKTFKDVEVMPPNHPGYDFICNKGKKIDVKASCTKYRACNGMEYWAFSLNRNMVADHFLCIAFDDRDNLTPLHVWLLPVKDFIGVTNTVISKTTLHKWDRYSIDMDGINEQCDKMRGE